MKRTLILLAGYPGTGKTYLGNIIISRFQTFQLLSPDEIKEKNWDQYGFDNEHEKEFLIQKSWAQYYDSMKLLFSKGKQVMSDYPFSDKQKETIKSICKDYGYQVITLRLVGDIPVLFERQKTRDLDKSRHLGHILSSYHYPQQMTKREDADSLLDFKEFENRCLGRGYGEFSMGYLYEIDVSDFSKIDYEEILTFISEKIKD
jgi:predicted kinase